MKILRDIAYGAKPHQLMDLYLPDTQNGGMIVYFHGGGIESGNKSDANYGEMAAQFCQDGYAFASVDYLLYPQGARFPDYIVDCAKAVGFLKADLKKYGCDTLYVAGQSAGAWIALMLCFNGEYLRAEHVENADIGGWLIDSAQTTSHFNVLRYERGEDPRAQRIDEFSPIYYFGENMSFSRMLLMFYENDMPCRKEQNLLFVRAVKEFMPHADIEYHEMEGEHCHGSTQKDEQGNYPFVTVAIQWLGK